MLFFFSKVKQPIILYNIYFPYFLVVTMFSCDHRGQNTPVTAPMWQAWGFTSHGRGTNVAGEVFYMLLGISLFEGNMVASGFESYLVALCFILWEGACTGSYRTRSYDK